MNSVFATGSPEAPPSAPTALVEMPAEGRGVSELAMRESGGFSGFTGLFVALAVACVAAAWLRRRNGAPGPSVLQAVGSCGLGPRRQATLLRVGSRVVLVGVSDGGVRSLGEWDEEILGDEASEVEADPAADREPTEGPAAAQSKGTMAARFAKLMVPGSALLLMALVVPALALAQASTQGVTVNVSGLPGWESGRLSSVIEISVLITALTFLPALILTCTCFTRFIVVFHFLRQALGIPGTPPNQVLVGLALFLTAFVMAPVAQQSWEQGLEPYRDGTITFEEAVNKGSIPLKDFMLRNTRPEDLSLMLNIAGDPHPQTREDVSLRHLLPAYIISELNTAFMAGFLIFLPFIIIDMLVASVLLSMGMMMMPPVMVSMPIKVMVFVLAGGWNLLIGSFVAGVQ